MDLRHIRYFVTVAKHLSFTKAAEALHIAQPPLSQQIQNLEKELGYDLFIRSNRSISLTQAGKDLLEDSVALLERMEQFEKKALLKQEGHSGTLHISLISSFVSKAFADMIRQFRKSVPDAKISLDIHPTMWQRDALQKGRIDVGFIMLPSTHPMDSSEGQVLLKGHMKLAVHPQHPLAKKGKAEWSDLAEEPLILVEPESIPGDYYSEFNRHCRRAGFEPLASQYANNVATQIWMASAGMGVAPLFIAPELETRSDISFVSLPSNAPKFDTYITWRKEDCSPLLEKFVKHARVHFAQKG